MPYYVYQGRIYKAGAPAQVRAAYLRGFPDPKIATPEQLIEADPGKIIDAGAVLADPDPLSGRVDGEPAYDKDTEARPA